MKFAKVIISVLFIASLTLGAQARDDGWGRNGAYSKLFNSKSIETVTGEVVKIDRDCRPLKGMEAGFCVVVRDDKGKEIEAQVGPAWFTSFYREKWEVREGDKVSVTGSLVEINGKKALIVTQGSKGDLKMTCRSNSGAPVWDLDLSDFRAVPGSK